jgi:hypothetical protein
MDAVKEDPPPGHCDRYVICKFNLHQQFDMQSFRTKKSIKILFQRIHFNGQIEPCI